MGLVVAFVGGSASHAAGEARTPHDVVVYSIGISTNPYGRNKPVGFGVVTGLSSGRLKRVEVRRREYAGFPGAEWLDRGRILVNRHAPPLRPPAIFSYRNGRLVHAGIAPFPGGSVYRWSPDWSRVAFEPSVPCRPGQASLFDCYKSGTRIFIADGSGTRQVASGVLGGWTTGSRLVVYKTMKAWARGDAIVLDLATGNKRSRRKFWLDQQPIRSADGQYLAWIHGVKHRTEVIVSHAGGRVVQTLTTHYILSMFAWSTRGHLLAYTTSGFPSPHQLFVVDPGHEPRKIFATGRRHFDWITWSPDGRQLLLDGDAAGGWRVFSARTGRQLRLLRRLGGRPFWCCPVNEYRGNGR
jgi:hypothetical protein